MMKRVWILSVILPALLPAALQRIEVSERSDVLDGKSFAAAGPYERITGKAYFAVDPNLPANKIITDIAKAPRNATGLVEFSADFYCLKPRDPKNGNHALLFEVSNRGGKGMLGTFDFGGSLDPRTQADFGDDFLLEQGYTLVWLGWEFDVPPGPAMLRLYAPVAKGITGLVRSEITVDHVSTRQSLGDRNVLAYPVSNPADPALVLTVRDQPMANARRFRAMPGISKAAPTSSCSPVSNPAASTNWCTSPRSSARWPGSRRRPRFNLVLQIRHPQRHTALRPARIHQTRLRLRHFPERPFPAHLPLLRFQSG